MLTVGAAGGGHMPRAKLGSGASFKNAKTGKPMAPSFKDAAPTWALDHQKHSSRRRVDEQALQRRKESSFKYRSNRVAPAPANPSLDAAREQARKRAAKQKAEHKFTDSTAGELGDILDGIPDPMSMGKEHHHHHHHHHHKGGK